MSKINTFAVFLFAICAGLTICATTRHSFICEGSDGPITCAAGKKINVLNAYYGRTHDNSICSSESTSNQTENCRAPSSSNLIKTTCQNKQQCSLAANSGVFGDPCVGTRKYIEMKFVCVQA